jgi:hypothetical protein
MSEDPIGLVSNICLYRYVNNSSITLGDWFGLYEIYPVPTEDSQVVLIRPDKIRVTIDYRGKYRDVFSSPGVVSTTNKTWQYSQHTFFIVTSAWKRLEGESSSRIRKQYKRLKSGKCCVTEWKEFEFERLVVQDRSLTIIANYTVENPTSFETETLISIIKAIPTSSYISIAVLISDIIKDYNDRFGDNQHNLPNINANIIDKKQLKSIDRRFFKKPDSEKSLGELDCHPSVPSTTGAIYYEPQKLGFFTPYTRYSVGGTDPNFDIVPEKEIEYANGPELILQSLGLPVYLDKPEF